MQLAEFNNKFVEESKTLMKTAHLQMEMLKSHGFVKISEEERALLTKSLFKSQKILEEVFEMFNNSTAFNIKETNHLYTRVNLQRKETSTMIKLLDTWSLE
jgi:hypothetical protein